MTDITWEGPLLDCSGYATAGRGYIWALDKAGRNIRAINKSRSVNLRGKGIDDKINELYKKLFSNKVENDILIQHQVPDVVHPKEKYKFNAIYSIFEMKTVPEIWAERVKEFDILLTGSEYSKESFVNTGVSADKIKVIPHVIDTDFYSPDGEKWQISNLKGFNFVALFDFTARKGWKELLTAYWNAFKKTDDVTLTLKVYYNTMDVNGLRNIMEKIEGLKREQGRKETPVILLYGYDISSFLIPSFYRTFDCFVQVSREGFGLPFAEAMACGLLAIGPETGGNRAFMDYDNSLLVKHTGWSPIDPELVETNPLFNRLEWPVYSVNHLAHLMRYAYENSINCGRIKNLGLESIRKKLNWKVVSNLIIDSCRKI